jgi:hypothetical protein
MAMGAVVWAGWLAWTRFVPKAAWSDATGLAVMIAGGVVVYGAAVWSLRLEGREEIVQLLRQKLRGKKV